MLGRYWDHVGAIRLAPCEAVADAVGRALLIDGRDEVRQALIFSDLHDVQPEMHVACDDRAVRLISQLRANLRFDPQDVATILIHASRCAVGGIDKFLIQSQDCRCHAAALHSMGCSGRSMNASPSWRPLIFSSPLRFAMTCERSALVFGLGGFAECRVNELAGLVDELGDVAHRKNRACGWIERTAALAASRVRPR